MNPKDTPFTDAYVKAQESVLSRGYKLYLTIGAVIVVGGAILAFVRPERSYGLIPLAMIILLWGAVAKQRLNTFRENLELYKMIKQLHKE